MREEGVVLVRDCIHVAPDGNSVHRTETMKVTIEWPEGFSPRKPDSYYEPSDWKIAGVR